MNALVRTLCVLFPILLVVPFDPQWPDFERARRGLLMLLVGIGVLAFGVRARPPGKPFLWLLGLAVLALVSSLWADDSLTALEHGAYLLALFAVPWLLPASAELRAGVAVALALTAGYGIYQCLGGQWPAHYTVLHEPVSSLGNRNVAAEWTAVATPLALTASPALGICSATLGGLYLWGNGGRAALIAFHLAIGVLLLARPRMTRIVVPALVILGLLGALVLRPAAPGPSSGGTVAQRPAEGPVPSTVQVRLLIWPRTLELARTHFPLGTGAGNFAVHFPKHRDPEEIKISSHGHKFGSRVRTPHNDALHFVAELGLLGGALLALFLLSLWQAWRAGSLSLPALASLAAFVPLALMRSPTFNAPAATVCLLGLMCGLRGDDKHIPATWLRGLRLLGLPLAVLGAIILLGERGGAGFFRAKRVNDGPAGLAAINSAIAYDVFETDWRLLRAQVHHRLGSQVAKQHLQGTLTDLHAVLERRPGSYKALVDVGYLGLAHQNVIVGKERLYDRGRESVTLLLELDPNQPQGLLLKSKYAFQDGDQAAGVAALERLGRLGPIVARLRQVRSMYKSVPLEQRVTLAALSVKLRQLGEKLFPGHEEFRKE